MLRCRAGDLAVLIRGEDTGAFVDVVERCADHPRTGLPSWSCRAKAPLVVTLMGMRTGRPKGRATVPPGEEVCIMDQDLQPIRPPKQPLTQPAPEIEHAAP